MKMKVGDKFSTRDKGKRRYWGTIIGIDDDNVTVYDETNPVGYKERVESLNSMEKWYDEKLIKLSKKRK